MLSRLAVKGRRACRMLTSPARMRPDFIIIGAAKCGTTSLYNYLARHPSVVPARTKEIHYFDFFFERGSAWYRSHFTLRSPIQRMRANHRRTVTGEASPYYIFHPHALRRIAEALPRVRLIALLRNPADRAYSQYQHVVRLGYETLSFEDAIASEEERLAGEVEKMRADERYYSFNHQYYSYLARGIYVDQISRLAELGFAPEQVLILRSEDFFAHPAEGLLRLREFLGLPEHPLRDLEKFNAGRYEKIPAAMRARLLEFYEPHNQRLADLLGASFNWE
jgi:hypothetical protein